MQGIAFLEIVEKGEKHSRFYGLQQLFKAQGVVAVPIKY